MRSALFERVLTLQGRSVGGQFLDWHGTKLVLPNSSTRCLEWLCLPWNVLLCAVVYFVVRVWSVSSLDETVGVFPCEAERPGQLLTYSLFSVVQNCPEVRDS